VSSSAKFVVAAHYAHAMTADVTADRYADRPAGARLLLIERDSILPILRALPDEDFDRPTALPGWSVRDVLAHCAAALTMTANGTGHGYTPAENQRDVDERRPWPIGQLLDELTSGYDGAAEMIAAADGRLDLLALGEWTHGGDVREALGIPDAYASAGVEEALPLFERLSRRPRFDIPPTNVRLPDRRLRLGPADAGSDDVSSDGDPDGSRCVTLQTDVVTLVRMLTGRSPSPDRYRLDGAESAQYAMFG
jgi:uncharacterized protein (TIGR03083 family)